MNRDILEVNAINWSVVGVIHLVDIREVMSITLIAITIGYTIWKWRAGK